MKKVSAILTTYNSEKFIQRTIHSILNQEGIGSIFELELLVVDDCSSDNTLEKIRETGISPFKTRSNTGGPNKGRNIGLKKATGDYICIADHDDIWEPFKIKALLPHLENAQIVTSGYTQINNATGKSKNRKCIEEKKIILYNKNATFISKLTKSLLGQSVYLGSIIYHSNLKDILFEEEFGVVDFDWVLRLFHNRHSIEVCESLYNRYVDNSNLSLDESYREKDFLFSLQFIKQYEREYPREVNLSRKRIHGSRARYYYVMNNMKKARYYFRRSDFTLKTLAYYLTTYYGSKYVVKKFNVFG